MRESTSCDAWEQRTENAVEGNFIEEHSYFTLRCGQLTELSLSSLAFVLQIGPQIHRTTIWELFQDTCNVTSTVNLPH